MDIIYCRHWKVNMFSKDFFDLVVANLFTNTEKMLQNFS